jgi:hypothetical protein
MKLNSPSLPAIGIIIFLVLLGACKKSNVSGGTDSTNIPFTTPIGDTAGAPVSASIGPTGGSLTSSDGRVQLVIPAGALSQTTIITIQPIINLCPGGIGLAYDLQPTGTKFSTPASLIFHYSDSDVNGTEPLLITSVFQDSANAWEFNDTEKDVDSINKKISFEIDHFCANGFIAEIVVSSRPTSVKENQTSQVKVQQWIVPKDLGSYKGGKFVQSRSDIANSLVTNWLVRNYANASGDPGTITGNGSAAVYLAPSNIDKDKSVEVSCNINVPVTVKLKGGGTVTIKTPLIEENSIGLISGVYSMNLSILVAMNQSSFFVADRYTDGATMQIDVKYNDVTIGNIVNRAPTVDPAVLPFGDGAVAWVPDLIGVTNILPTSTGKFTADYQGGYMALDFKHSSTVYPSWVLTSPNGPAQYSGGSIVQGQPVSIEFHTQTQAQTLYTVTAVGYDSIYFVITPIQ